MTSRARPMLLMALVPAFACAQPPDPDPSAPLEESGPLGVIPAPAAVPPVAAPDPLAIPPQLPTNNPGMVLAVHPAIMLNVGGIWGPDEEKAPREFFVGNARAFVRGLIAPPGTDPAHVGDDPHFGYFFQLETVNSPPLLDAFVTGQFSRALRVDAGLTKVPISDEFILAAADTDFNSRARVIRRLAPKRAIGAQLGGQVAEGALRYVAGVYDQNTIQGAADIPPIYAGRLDGHIQLDGGKLALGLASGVRPSAPDSDRAIYADANARLDYGPLWLASEFLFGGFEPESDEEDATVSFGEFVTLGYHITETVFALARYDRFTEQDITQAAILAGVGWQPFGPLLIQMEYDHPVEGDEPITLQAYAQVWLKF